MAEFVAHYKSPNASAARAKGAFEFESNSRLGSKANAHDARVKMLELFGNEALTWSVDKIEHKSAPKSRKQTSADGQLQLDFREPVEVKVRKRRRSTKRGLV